MVLSIHHSINTVLLKRYSKRYDINHIKKETNTLVKNVNFDSSATAEGLVLKMDLPEPQVGGSNYVFVYFSSEQALYWVLF